MVDVPLDFTLHVIAGCCSSPLFRLRAQFTHVLGTGGLTSHGVPLAWEVGLFGAARPQMGSGEQCAPHDSEPSEGA